MFNLLRSIFWLGVVFTAMFWNGETPDGAARPADIAQSAARRAAAVASDYCAARPLECLDAAQKLTALFEKVAAEPEVAEVAPETPEPAPAAASAPANAPPLPPVRPASLSGADRRAAWRGKASQ